LKAIRWRLLGGGATTTDFRLQRRADKRCERRKKLPTRHRTPKEIASSLTVSNCCYLSALCPVRIFLLSTQGKKFHVFSGAKRNLKLSATISLSSFEGSPTIICELKNKFKIFCLALSAFKT